jgi:uncharacterized glyoxalase superfamily protein PhnB
MLFIFEITGTKAIEWFKKVLGFEESDAIDICNKLLNQKLLRLKSEREGQSPSPFRKDEKYVFNVHLTLAHIYKVFDFDRIFSCFIKIEL